MVAVSDATNKNTNGSSTATAGATMAKRDVKSAKSKTTKAAGNGQAAGKSKSDGKAPGVASVFERNPAR